MTSISERREMMDAGICFVCLQPIPAAGAVYHVMLGVLAHRGECSDLVNGLYKDYTRSRRGRCRAPGVVRRLVEEARGRSNDKRQ